ncbi:9045_t:CDS:2 [Ambispora gerdemannii]|uniref:9045_t:CDS:1 n=1 Tax=Ambispora gerdemannii TaxID=144530 RepID=A0A9N8WJS6_9GLOM|nr:9045_t:CDS:2 [Ambispora gerdemannii]
MCSASTNLMNGQPQNLIQYITVTQLTPQIVTRIVYVPSPVTLMTQQIPSNYATLDQIKKLETLEPVKYPETQQSMFATFATPLTDLSPAPLRRSMATLMQQSFTLVISSQIPTQNSLQVEPNLSHATRIISAFSFPTFQYTATPTFTSFPTTTPYSTETRITRKTPSIFTTSTETSITLPPTRTETAGAWKIAPNQESSLLYLAGFLGIIVSTFLLYIF